MTFLYFIFIFIINYYLLIIIFLRVILRDFQMSTFKTLKKKTAKWSLTMCEVCIQHLIYKNQFC